MVLWFFHGLRNRIWLLFSALLNMFAFYLPVHFSLMDELFSTYSIITAVTFTETSA